MPRIVDGEPVVLRAIVSTLSSLVQYAIYPNPCSTRKPTTKLRHASRANRRLKGVLQKRPLTSSEVVAFVVVCLERPRTSVSGVCLVFGMARVSHLLSERIGGIRVFRPIDEPTALVCSVLWALRHRTEV